MKKILVILLIVSFVFVLWECLFYDRHIGFFGGLFTFYFSILLNLLTLIILLPLLFLTKFKKIEVKKYRNLVLLNLICLGINLYGFYLCDGFREVEVFVSLYVLENKSWPP